MGKTVLGIIIAFLFISPIAIFTGLDGSNQEEKGFKNKVKHILMGYVTIISILVGITALCVFGIWIFCGTDATVEFLHNW